MGFGGFRFWVLGFLGQVFQGFKGSMLQDIIIPGARGSRFQGFRV